MNLPDPALAVEVQLAVRRPWVPAKVALRRWAEAAHRAALVAPARRRHVAMADGLCVRVVGAAESRRLNRQYRGRDKPTNVLSFPASSEELRYGGSLGDIVICATVVAAEAREQRKSRSAHWAHMVAHGVLHLHGHDHHQARAARAMERLEVEILAGFGYQNPYHPADGPGP